MFSSRLRHAAGRNRLAVAIDRRRAEGGEILDLTLSNPTRAGLAYPHGLLAPMAQDRSLCYEPEPFGLASARERFSRPGAAGVTVPQSDRTKDSTSEAIRCCSSFVRHASVLGATVLPAIEILTDLEGGHRALSSRVHGRWSSITRLREKASMTEARQPHDQPKTRPARLNDSELDAVARCARAHLALISEEVLSVIASPRSTRRRFVSGGVTL